MITVLIEAWGTGQLSFEYPDPVMESLFYTNYYMECANWFQGNIEKSNAGMISYPE